MTFRAGEATATLNIHAHFFGGSTVTGETALTATVQAGSGYTVGDPATASTRIRVADPAVTASFEQAAYTFDEAAGDATVAVILRTAASVPIPHADIFFYINYELITGGASDKGDFEFSADAIKFVPSDFTADGATFTARKEVTLAIVDDALDEPDEALTLILEPLPSTQAVVALSEPDGTACSTVRRCDATVTITDNDESAVATLSALAVSGGGADLLTFSSDTTTYTAMVANDVETLTFSATKSDDGASVAYLDSDGNTLDDADTTEDGFQVALAVGANAITVRVTAENGTTQDYTVTVTRAEALPTVTIAADHASFTAVLDKVTFTLTRTEDPAEELDVSVALTQDKDLIGSDHLAQTVTFRAGEATATLNILAHFFAGSTVTGETTLTATEQAGSGYTVGDPATASTRIRVADPAVTASFEQAAYTFDEAAGDANIAVILRTATGVPIPHADIFLYINYETIPGGASPGGVDFENPPAGSIRFLPDDFTADGPNFTARKEVTLAIVDDALDEPDEALTVILEALSITPAVVALRRPDGTACRTTIRCDATVNDHRQRPSPPWRR